MDTAAGAGRIVGTCMLAQLIAGIAVNFVLLEPVFAPPGFALNAAVHSATIGVAALLGLANGMLSVGIAVAAAQVLRASSRAMALALIALATASLSLAAVENMHLMSMLSFSEAYAKADLADRGSFEVVRGVVAASRNWAHYVALVVAGCMLAMFYSALLRFSLVPRGLSAAVLGAVMLQIIAVSMPLFGHKIVLSMLLPLAVGQLLTALWLIVKGFSVAESLGSALRGPLPGAAGR